MRSGGRMLVDINCAGSPHNQENGRHPSQQVGGDGVCESEVETTQTNCQEMYTNGMQSKKLISPNGARDIVKGSEDSLLQEKLNSYSFDNIKYKNRTSEDGNLPEKIFEARESVLTVLFQMKHIACIRSITIAMFIILFLNIALNDILTTGKLNLGFERIQWCFGGFHNALFVWAQMMVCTMAVHECFKYWALNRTDMMGLKKAVWDYGWLLVFILYQIMFLMWPCLKILKSNFGPASTFALVMEQIRLMMKTHAFVRSCAPRFLSFKPHSDKEAIALCPTFGHFLYFMFAPTAVYRDTYPRSDKRRWKVVIQYFLQVIALVIYMNLIAEKYVAPLYHNYGKNTFSPDQLVKSVFSCMIPATMLKIFTFFGLLHSWMNAFAEMLQFGDRMFYKDWWNAKSFGEYFRKWNGVVHDWLYTYIYRDYCQIFNTKNPVGPTLCAFVISGIAHEYFVICTFQFFYPLFLVMLGAASVILISLTKSAPKNGNIFLWWSLIFGCGIFMSMYIIEWNARVNCPRIIDSAWDKVVPRSWYCGV